MVKNNFQFFVSNFEKTQDGLIVFMGYNTCKRAEAVEPTMVSEATEECSKLSE